jgi:biopolymer transport protein ExbB
MDSHFGLMNVWNQGDFVTRAVALLLIGMSLASWIVILIKALDIVRYKRLAKHSQDFWHSEDFATALNKLGKDDGNPFRALALEGREAAAHHRNTKAHLHDALDVSDWITRALRNGIDEFTARLQTGLAILASVGSTAPFIGLFGTVWGIMTSFQGIANSGQTNLAVVAPGIAEALFATAIGLVAAIPATIFYNMYSNDAAKVQSRLENFADEFSAIISRQLDERA